jgi:predicted Abi (CAAX) family protease
MGAPGDRNAAPLQDGKELRRPTLVARVMSVIVLIGMFVTSLNRAPEPAWSVVLIVVAYGLAVALPLGVRSHRRHR